MFVNDEVGTGYDFLSLVDMDRFILYAIFYDHSGLRTKLDKKYEHRKCTM